MLAISEIKDGKRIASRYWRSIGYISGCHVVGNSFQTTTFLVIRKPCFEGSLGFGQDFVLIEQGLENTLINNTVYVIFLSL